MEYSFGIGCDLAFHCGDFIFQVNSEVIAEASSVWRAMVKGHFAESTMDVINLEEDDPEALKLTLGIVYAGLSGTVDLATIPVHPDSQPLLAIIDKYELNGVRVLVEKEIMNRKERCDHEQEVVSLKTRHTVALEREKQEHDNFVRYRLMRPGMKVDSSDRPPVGTRVEENLHDTKTIHMRYDIDQRAKKGTIIANDEDNGTEIGVRWNNGSESHHLWCNKKGGHALLYA